MSPSALALLAACSFAGSFLGQRIRLPAAWAARVELLALRSAKAALELERKARAEELRAALDSHAKGCPHRDCPWREAVLSTPAA